MADAKVDLKELPKHSARIFTRVVPVELSPTLIYDVHDVAEEDRAIFTVRPASPSERDDLKDIVLEIEDVKGEILKSYGVTSDDITRCIDMDSEKPILKKLTQKKYNAVNEAFSKVEIYARRAMSTDVSRKAMAPCITATNYKIENEERDLVVCNDQLKMAMTMPDVFCVFFFRAIQPMSNLTTQEVVGL